ARSGTEYRQPTRVAAGRPTAAPRRRNSNAAAASQDREVLRRGSEREGASFIVRDGQGGRAGHAQQGTAARIAQRQIDRFVAFHRAIVTERDGKSFGAAVAISPRQRTGG